MDRVFAQDKLVIAIQPSVSSDEMLKKAQPLEKFLRDGFGGKTDIRIYIPTSYAAVVESLRFGHAQSLSCLLARAACSATGRRRNTASRSPRSYARHEKSRIDFLFFLLDRLEGSPYQNLELARANGLFSQSDFNLRICRPYGSYGGIESDPTAKGKEGDPKAFFKDVVFGGGYGQCAQL